ncbi:MAG TPA: hypothetical protein PKY96_18710 [Flavobacteriales bacterium]|nr:hypothetical protein [Flavobacteriales bacterium]
MDTDRTAVTIEVIQDGQLLHAFRNFYPDELNKEIYGNQSEAFQLPDLPSALAFVRSNQAYKECSVEVLEN